MKKSFALHKAIVLHVTTSPPQTRPTTELIAQLAGWEQDSQQDSQQDSSPSKHLRIFSQSPG